MARASAEIAFSCLLQRPSLRLPAQSLAPGLAARQASQQAQARMAAARPPAVVRPALLAVATLIRMATTLPKITLTPAGTPCRHQADRGRRASSPSLFPAAPGARKP